jgi:hypothetical protein
MTKLLATLATILVLSFTTDTPPPKIITLKLTVEQVEVVLQGLGELKMNVSYPVSQTIIQQAQKQINDTTQKK